MRFAMKDKFKGFYRLSEEEYDELWQKALFIPDSSFLCNLYRLPASSREEMFKALDAVSNRIWVPHQVALEFFRNRPAVIADQRKKFSEVKNLIFELRDNFTSELKKLKLKKRHSLINPDTFEKRLKELLGDFNNEITALEEQQITIDSDPILNDLAKLINDKIGEPPENQDKIDELYKKGEIQYQKKIPPGYMDASKSKDKEGPFYGFGGIVYQRQFGDFLIWTQILEEAKNSNQTSVIFLTDDSKEDWYWIVGGQKLGPRPELVEEIFKVAGVKHFHIYSTEQFLEYASHYFKIKISAESIEAAKDIAEVTREESDLLSVAENDPEPIVGDIIKELGSDLIKYDVDIEQTIAETNASSWILFDFFIVDLHYDEQKREITFSADLALSGEQDIGKPFSGDEMDVSITGKIAYRGDSFELARYEIDAFELNFEPEH